MFFIKTSHPATGSYFKACFSLYYLIIIFFLLLQNASLSWSHIHKTVFLRKYMHVTSGNSNEEN